jgi:hypothetical protein
MFDHLEPLCDVAVDNYRLQTWDTGASASSHSAHQSIAYRLTSAEGVVIFENNDFGCSPYVAIDSDSCLRSLLGFLTLRPGDTDAEYFEDYTPEQLAFAEGDAEHLQCWTFDEMPFVDWPEE